MICVFFTAHRRITQKIGATFADIRTALGQLFLSGGAGVCVYVLRIFSDACWWHKLGNRHVRNSGFAPAEGPSLGLGRNARLLTLCVIN